LETARLVIRPFVAGDASGLFRILGDAEVMRFSVDGPHRDAAVTARWIDAVARHQARHGFSICAVVERGGGALVGKCGLAVLADGRTEIAYRTRRDRWGSGYATEAAAAWLGRAFGSIGLTHVVAMIEAANHASIRVAEKIGMHPTGRETFHGIPVIAYVAEATRRGSRAP
jgi:RimJ/RimL family protein N-acetyltransferase